MSDFYLEVEEIKGLSDSELESLLWEVLPEGDEDEDLGSLFSQADSISDHRDQAEIDEAAAQWQELQADLAEVFGYEDLE